MGLGCDLWEKCADGWSDSCVRGGLTMHMKAKTITEAAEYADTAVHLVVLADVFRAAER